MNPEFQRNLWLETSPRRIAWAAVTLVLIYGAVILFATHLNVQVDVNGAERRFPDIWRALSGVGAAVFVVCAVFWAGRAAAGAVLSETAERTWDFQRLSALTAWEMTWGKLAGATSLAWLCAATGLVLYAVGSPSDSVGWNAAFLLALALLVQAISLGASLVGIRKARAEGRVARSGGVLGGLLLGALLLLWLAGTARFGRGVGLSGLGALFRDGGFVDWWGLFPRAEVFRAVSMAAFAGFVLAGAWRLMRLELQMQNQPVVWPAFLVFFGIWTAGFTDRTGGPGVALLTAGLAMALCAYAAAFAEPADRVRLRRFAGLVRRGEIAEAARLAPASLIPMAAAILLVGVAYLAGGTSVGGLGPGQPAALTAFVLRDLGVIALFRFGPRPQRGDFAAIVALAVLYGVGAAVSASLDRVGGGALFVPTGDVLSLVSGLVQAAIAWGLAAQRIRMPPVRLSAPPSAQASAPAS